MQIRSKSLARNSSQYSNSSERTIGSDSIRENANNQINLDYKRKRIRRLKRKNLFNQYKRLIPQDKNLNQQGQNQFSNFFTQHLNIIYEKISILPKKLYVCGYCRQYFNTKFSYIAHCLVQKCQINHERSTYHFYLKDKQQQANLCDFQRCLSNKLFIHILKSQKIQDNTFFKIKFNLFRNQKAGPKLLECGSCNFFRNFNKDMFQFLYHILYQCKCPTSQKNSHKMIRKQFIQSKSQFIQDINNLTLNYNLLNLHKGSYLKVRINKSFVPKNYPNFNQFYCGICNKQFQNSNRFIEHSLFACEQKQNLVSSHVIQKVKMHQILLQTQEVQQKSQNQQSQNQKNTQKCQRKINKAQINVNKQQIHTKQTLRYVKKTQKYVKKTLNNVKNILKYGENTQKYEKEIQPIKQQWNFEVKVNKLYQSLDNEFGLQIYKCGGCKNTFENKLYFVAHSAVYLCKINHPYSSHFVYRKNIDKMISQQECFQLLTTQQKQAFYNRHPTMFKQFYSRIRIIAKSNQQQYVCGKCLTRYECQYHNREQFFYIRHITTKCFCPYFQTNSHPLIVQNPQIQLSNQDDIIASMKKLIITQKISKYDSSALYLVQANKKQQWDSTYVCGQCQIKFSDQYELVYHSILCDSLKSKKGSHLIVVKKRQQQDPIIKIIDFREQKPTQHIKEVIQTKPNNQTNIQHKRRDRITQSRLIIPQIKIDEQIFQLDQHELYENIHFDNAKTNLKYYCGPCKIQFNRYQTFTTHLQECKKFSSKQSSHFYQTKNQRYQQLNKMAIKNTAFQKLLKQDIIIKEMSKLIPTQQYKCGCGKILRKDEYSNHIMHYHDNVVPNQSSHIVLKLLVVNNKKTVLFPVQSDIQFNVDYSCPCKAKVKLNRKQFVYHIIKRHHGKSPIFYMEPQNYKPQ